MDNVAPLFVPSRTTFDIRCGVFRATFSVRLLAILLFLLAPCLQAQSGASESPLRALPPQLVYPSQGYRVFRQPDLVQTPVREVTADEVETEFEAAACYLTNSGRFFIDAANLASFQAGTPAEWVWIPGVSDLPFFVPPESQRNQASLSWEEAGEKFSAGDYVTPLAASIREYEETLHSGQWDSSVTRHAYNVLYMIAYGFATLGDLAQAETAFLAYSAVAMDHWGPVDRRGGLIPQGEVAGFYRSIGNHGKELPILENSFQIHYAWDGSALNKLDYSKALNGLKEDVVEFAGNEQIEAFRLFLDLVRCTLRHGDPARADQLAADLLDVLGKIDLVNGTETATRLHEDGLCLLAEWRLGKGGSQEAVAVLEKVIERQIERGEDRLLSRDYSLLLARAYLENGQPGKALALISEHEGKFGFHFELEAVQLQMLASLDSGDTGSARLFAAKLENLQTERARQVLAFSSEEQRVRFMRQLRPLLGWLALGDTEAVARVALRFKGLILDASLEEAAGQVRATDEATRRVQDNLSIARQTVHRLKRELEAADATADGGTSGEGSALAFQAAVAEVDRLEGELARKLNSVGLVRGALSAEPGQVRASLKDGRRVIEFIAADRYQGRGRTEKIYVAVRYTPDGEAMRACGPVAELNAQVKSLREGLVEETLDDEALAARLKSLEASLFGDWLPESPTGSTLLVSPDGELNFVPFSALQDASGRMLVERFDLGIVSSARDAAAEASPWQVNSALLMGNPSFDTTLASGGNGLQWSRADEQRRAAFASRGKEAFAITFDPLPGAELEVIALDALLKEKQVRTQLLIGPDAMESAIRQPGEATLIHLATHGHLLPEASVQPGFVTGQMSSSLVLCTGANATLQSWSRGLVKDTANDGVISADEFAQMNFGHVQAMILSACETGLGAAQPGEGVMGLRRGLHQAGVRHLVTSLWPISDEATVEVMRNFYDRSLGREMSPLRALAQTQRELLLHWRSEHGLATAVFQASPFIISISKGRTEEQSTEVEPLRAAGWIPSSSVTSAPLSRTLAPVVNPTAAAPSTTPGSSSTPLPGEKYPQTRLRALTEDEVSGLTFGQVRYAINEMFARHGAVFSKPEIQEVFDGKSWYERVPDLTFDEIEELYFSETEQENLKLLGAHRDRVKR